MSLAAWTPSSFSAFSMILFRSSACRSSALIEHPILPATSSLVMRLQVSVYGGDEDSDRALVSHQFRTRLHLNTLGRCADGYLKKISAGGSSRSTSRQRHV